MTVWSNNLNGIASGTTVTTGNSGGVSGTAFSAVELPSGGSITAQAAAAVEGATGLQIVFTSTSLQSGDVYWTVNSPVGTRVAASFWYRFSALPAATTSIFGMNGGLIRLTSTGALTVVGSGTTAGTSTAVTPGTWVFVQFAWTPQGTNTSRLECKITNTAGTSLLSVNNATLGVGSTIDRVTFGLVGLSNPAVNTHSYDLLAADNTLAVGAFPGAAAPSAFSGGMKVWNGSAWVIKPVKVWTGSAWVTKPVKRWNGSAWVVTP